MKKIFLLVVIAIASAKMYGQQILINSLESQLAKHNARDSFVVNRLNQLALLYDVPIAKRDSIAKEALKLSRQINYSSGEAIALANMAVVKNDMGNPDIADSLSTIAVSLAEKSGDQFTMAMVYKEAGVYKAFAGEARAGINYYLKAEAICRQNNFIELLSLIQGQLSGVYSTSLSDYTTSLAWALKSLKNAESINNLNCLEVANTAMGQVYDPLGDKQKALEYIKKALAIDIKIKNKTRQVVHLINIGENYRTTGKYDTAIYYYRQALSLAKNLYLIGMIKSNMADTYVRSGDFSLAIQYGSIAMNNAQKVNDQDGIAWIGGILGRACLYKNMPDSALYFSGIGLNAALETGSLEFSRDNYEVLYKVYAQKKDYEKAYNYQSLFFKNRDSMLSAEVKNKTSLLQYNYDLEKKQAQITALNQEKKLQRFFLGTTLIVLVMILIFMVMLFRNNRQKNRANILLSNQKKVIEEQRNEVEKSLQQLQQTQNYLVHSEKMASLGELTAGIAHEIQNPLNFVNNFAEINKELLVEMKDEAEKGNLNQVKSLAEDVIANEEKINHHGKRADAIVKAMLLHSRTNTGMKELSDINKLADEYLRLAYHGMRAKSKSFNVTIQSHYDETIDPVNIIPQEVGRVILNLVTNALHAVIEKKKKLSENDQKQYEPTVSLTTKSFKSSSGERQVAISIKDNGNGIPSKFLDKIFQSFFTTRPTGQGTGLGLSLSYDIVKAHGGELKVETEEGKGSAFTIVLPVVE